MKFNKHTIYIGLFAILYLIVAFSSFWHAVAFFGLANNSWMSVILAFAFEVGQAAVLFSLLTSKKDRGRIMPWVLMSMFTLVQVIGNVYSSYKYIITNSVDNLRYFKEPIFIWTDLPNDQANVIIVYLVGALLPIAALLLTSMITNYLTDVEEDKNTSLMDKENQEKFEKVLDEAPEAPMVLNEGDSLLNQNSMLHMENQGLTESNQKKDEEIEQLKEQLHQTEEDHDKMVNEKFATEKKFDELLHDYTEQNKEFHQLKEELKSKQELIDSQNQKINDLDKENQELVKEKFDKEPKEDEYLEKHNSLKEYDNEEEIREDGLEENGQINEEGIEGDERKEDESNNIRPESSEKIIDEEDDRKEDKLDNEGQRPLETTNGQTKETISEIPNTNDEGSIKEEDTKSNGLVGDKEDIGIIDENLKVADALMGGNILSRSKKYSHFINNNKK